LGACKTKRISVHFYRPKQLLRGDALLFYSQYPLVTDGKEIGGTYLGFGSDLSLNFKPVKALEIIDGFFFTVSNTRMELLNKVPDSAKIPVWSYFMTSFAPRMLSRKWFRAS